MENLRLYISILLPQKVYRNAHLKIKKIVDIIERMGKWRKPYAVTKHRILDWHF